LKLLLFAHCLGCVLILSNCFIMSVYTLTIYLVIDSNHLLIESYKCRIFGTPFAISIGIISSTIILIAMERFYVGRTYMNFKNYRFNWLTVFLILILITSGVLGQTVTILSFQRNDYTLCISSSPIASSSNVSIGTYILLGMSIVCLAINLHNRLYNRTSLVHMLFINTKLFNLESRLQLSLNKSANRQTLAMTVIYLLLSVGNSVTMFLRLTDNCVTSLVALVLAGIIQQIYCTFSALAFVLTEDSLWNKGKTWLIMTTKFLHGLKASGKVAATPNTAPSLEKVKYNADAARYFRDLDNVWNQ